MTMSGVFNCHVANKADRPRRLKPECCLLQKIDTQVTWYITTKSDLIFCAPNNLFHQVFILPHAASKKKVIFKTILKISPMSHPLHYEF